jgi:ABC-2 type transport system permease protein
MEQGNVLTTITHELKASYDFMERNANLVRRYWSWELGWLVYSVVNSLSVSYIGLGLEAIGAAAAGGTEPGDLCFRRGSPGSS